MSKSTIIILAITVSFCFADVTEERIAKLHLDQKQYPNLRSGINYQAKAGDLFVTSYPKTGTTWTRTIVALLLNPDVATEDLSRGVVYLEAAGEEGLQNAPKPAIIVSHLPQTLLPWHDEAKYIVVVRNPKDTCVSYFEHHKKLKYIAKEASFQDFHRLFIDGKLMYGDFFTHYLEWLPLKGRKNVLFLVYEEMKTNIMHEILRIAEFIGGQELSDRLLTNQGHIFESIIRRSSFDGVKEAVDEAGWPLLARKGIIGDWVNYFNARDNELIQSRTHEMFKGTELDKLWDDYNVFNKTKRAY